ARAQREAEAFELRAKVALDQEQVEDVENLSPGRARARHQAARQLASEARMLCLAAQLVGAEAEALRKAGEELDKLETELGYGSVRQDMYPRAAEARNGCLFSLTLARRAEIQKAPDAAG